MVEDDLAAAAIMVNGELWGWWLRLFCLLVLVAWMVVAMIEVCGENGGKKFLRDQKDT
jgi:hypothetical protein